MSGNKAAYKEAFDRAREGKGQTLWQRIRSPFEDLYTQQSRAQGQRDGAAARDEGLRTSATS